MEIQKDTLNSFPKSPGIYIFKDKSGRILYIGKAINLERRISSYFRNEPGSKSAIMANRASSVETIPTVSEFDAILLEASLIRKYSPPFNFIAKDDKSPLYILISKHEEFPRVLTVRKSQLQTSSKNIVIGPFQSAKIARKLLSSLRHVVPFCTQKVRSGKPCFYTHLGLCGPCPSEVSHLPDSAERRLQTAKYKSNISRLIHVLTGKSRIVLDELEKNMQQKAIEEKFEEAGHIKRQIDSLYTIHTRTHDPLTYELDKTDDTFLIESGALLSILQNYFPQLTKLNRIECIDISNLGRTNPTGSLVVLTNGFPDPSQYRRFRIRTVQAPNDVFMISEVIIRRFSHPEWPKPDLFVVDGGKPQVFAAKTALNEHHISLPFIGLAKRNEEFVIPYGNSTKVVRLPLRSPALHLIQRIRDEAHRFARSYHLLLRRKLILKE